MRHVIFDTETTGIDPRDGHRLVEIGAVEMVNGALTGRSFHAYINPERDMPDDAYRVHKIAGDFLLDKPTFAHESVGPAFCAFCENATLVAHNAPFDVGFLSHELRLARLPQLKCDVIDTVRIARKRFPGSPASLDALCARFKIDLSERESQGHGALLDARLLAEVYIELTGGPQGGFVFKSGTIGQDGQEVSQPRPTRGRPRPILITDAEQAAHARFIAEMEAPIWGRLRAH
jgi:DNA polymerase-3 subunit epsilon